MKIGKYDILESVGKGGMGVVYRAYDPIIDREVALKTISVEALQNPTLHERFYREARAVGKLRHPNIITIHELGEEYGLPYIVMEYLPGTDLHEIIKAKQPIPIPRKIQVITEICRGLAYAHDSGVVHRDIKPSNVRIGKNGEVKIVDFGIARVLASKSKSSSGIVFGSVHYMSPEQIQGNTKVDGRSDIFSVGLLLYELLNYRKPFAAHGTAKILHRTLHDSPDPIDEEIRKQIPGVEKILANALMKKAAERYQSAAQMASDLSGL